MRYGAEILMIFKNNNFIRLFIGLNILLFSFFVEGKEFDYKFHWLYVPVAKLSINFNEFFDTDNERNHPEIKFQLSTKGPLKLIRNYQSTITKKFNKKGEWDYHLIGIDRGKPEEKLISYSSTSYPIVHTFIDDEGAEPLKIHELKDLWLIDPVSVLLKTIQRLNESKACSNEFFVFDGKRKYKVTVEHVDNENLSADRFSTFSGSAVHCQLKLISGTLFKKNKSAYLEEVGGPTSGLTIGPTEGTKYRAFHNNQWPFNGEERVIDIWFSSEKKYIPVKFAITTPLGGIIGRVVSNQ